MTRVLYVGGFTRSGSTLLSHLLGELEGFCTAGEVREVWTKGVAMDDRCTCGEPFNTCPFWVAVGERAFGGWDNIEQDQLADISRSLESRASIVPSLVATRSRTAAHLRLYSSRTASVIAAIADVSGCHTVVDSSKLAPFALALANEPSIELAVLHLVRDSRGVAFSWAKTGVEKPDSHQPGDTMASFTPSFTALRWLYHNALFEVMQLRGVRQTTVRYETLAASPARTLDEALAALRLGATRSDSAPETRVVLTSGSHAIGGNPMRFRAAVQTVRVDDEWEGAMGRRDRLGVTLLTWPLLLRYGYRPFLSNGSARV